MQKILLKKIFWVLLCAAGIAPSQAKCTDNPGHLVSLMKESNIYYISQGRKSSITGNPAIKQESQYTSLTWKDKNGSVILDILEARKGTSEITLRLEHTLLSSLFGNAVIPEAWGFELPLEKSEYVTGAFERVVDGKQNKSWSPGLKTAINLRGERVEIKLKPTVSAYAPFFLSSKGYGIYIKGTWPGIFDFGNADPEKLGVQFEGAALTLKYYRGTPMQIVQRHALDTGPSFIPPKWAFGPWRWRDNHENQKQYFDGTAVSAPYNSALVEDILLMQAYQIPCTAYWIDRPWGPGERGFDDYDWDESRFPEAQSMLDWLTQKDIAPMLWIAPFVMGKMATYANNQQYQLDAKPWLSKSPQILIDFTNPEAAIWWGKNGPAKLARQGVKGFKLDRADGEKLKDDIDLVTHDGRTYRENYNDYPRQYVKTAHDAVSNVLGNDFILFPRAQYTGSAQYGGMWAGDTGGSEWGLRSAIIALQRTAIMGYPIWGSDVGGYNRKEFDQQVATRWLAFSAFSPIMEVGPTADRGLWDLPDDPHYNPEVIASWRLYAKIKMALLDYSYVAAVNAHDTGTPVARPLFLMYPDQEQAWRDWQTYLYGNDILVSAIWRKDVTEHSLYLPKGETWLDAWVNNKEYAGGQTITIKTPLYKIPVFIRKGSKVKLPNLHALWKESLAIASRRPNLTELEAKESW